MSHVLVAVFDIGADARQARQELLDRGYGEQHVRLTPSLPASAHDDDPRSSVERSRSVAETVGEMFRSLFVEFGGTSDDEHLYNEAVRRGSVVMTVLAPDAQHEALIRDIIARHGAVDIHERGTAWRQQGWTQFDPAAPALTPEEIEAERHAARSRHGKPREWVRVYRAGRTIDRQQ